MTTDAIYTMAIKSLTDYTMNNCNAVPIINIPNINDINLYNFKNSPPNTISQYEEFNFEFPLSFDMFNNTNFLGTLPNIPVPIMPKLNFAEIHKGYLENLARMKDFMQSLLQNTYNASSGNNQGYGNYTHSITTLFKGTAADLNKHLKGKLAGKGAKLLELQNKYGISASMLAAIAIGESGNGSSNAAKTKNNIGGIMSKESNYTKLKTFNSIDECFDAMAKNLKNNYVDKGIKTISQIHKKYCPIGAGNDPNNLNVNWGKSVNFWVNKIEKNVS